jgi:two-component system cell cycle sensor histidine kinase/response regulator CckA
MASSHKNLYSIIQNIIKPISELIIIINRKSEILMVSDSFCDVFDFDITEIIGQPFLNIGSGYWNQPRLIQALDKIQSGKESNIDLEIEIELDTEYKRLISLNLCQISTGKTNYQLTAITIKKLRHPNPVTDIASLDNSQTLKAAQLSIEHAPDAVFWINRNGEFTYVNEQACRSLGYTRKELMKKRLWNIDPIYPKENWNKTWETAKKKDLINTEHIQTIHRRKNGEEFPVEVAARHITIEENEFHVSFVRDITERKGYEKALKITKSAIDNASIACFLINNKSKIFYVNEQACKSLGYTRDELIGMSVIDIDAEFNMDRWQTCWDDLVKIKAKTLEASHKKKDGTIFPVELTLNYLEHDGENYSCIYARDISASRRTEEEKLELEMQLYQAQKMETVGRLAGGIAHDFNNMLSVILGYIEMLKERLVNDPQSYEDLVQMEKAANHSKEITRQLLAFSRKQIITPKPLNINELIENTKKTLIRLIGENIQLEFIPCQNIWTIHFDPSQLDQIFVNLAINARDAMPHGGILQISTENIHADKAYCNQHVEVEPGDYVLLRVSDNGLGMDHETLSYIFEPFFTTKSVDQGTGLGLATVYGIMMQNNGFISVQSKPAVGTSFNLYIPKFEVLLDEKDEDFTQFSIAEPVYGTILLVEDDEMLRRMTTLMLQDIGYTVIAADSPVQALEIYKDNKDSIDLLMTDVVMPEMSGIELKEAITKENSNMNTLFMSGYTSNVIGDHGILEDGVNFIQKPFSMKNLNKQIRKAMGRE